IDSTTVAALCQPSAVPRTMPSTSPMAQPVRQWSVAEIAVRQSVMSPTIPPGGKWVKAALALVGRPAQNGSMTDTGTDGAATTAGAATAELRAARDRLTALRTDYAGAVETFHWPDVGASFNWVHDWFDTWARGNDRAGLVVVEEDGSRAEFSFAD